MLHEIYKYWQQDKRGVADRFSNHEFDAFKTRTDAS